MKVSVIFVDKVVVIDGLAIFIPELQAPSTWHALQWNGTQGQLEYVEPSKPNEMVTDKKKYLDPYVKLWKDKKALLDAEANGAIEDANVPLDQILASYRWMKQTAGVRMFDKVWHTDPVTVSNFIAKRLRYLHDKTDPKAAIQWKTAEGYTVISVGDFILISDEVERHVQKCYDAEAYVLTLIQQGKVKNEVEMMTSFDIYLATA